MLFKRSNTRASSAMASTIGAVVKRRADILDGACGVGLWDAILYEADALHPRSAWTWSPEFRRLCGYETIAEFPDVVQSWSDRLHPNDVEPTFAAFAGSLTNTSGACSYSVEYRLKVRDGSYRWFRASGGCGLTPDGRVHACGSLVDIDALKQTEARNAQARLAAEAIIAAMSDGLAHLARGDLGHRVEADFPPEYARLKADLNSTSEMLEAAISEVSEKASAIRSGTCEISSVSDDLSRRTEQQAASLEETAAALDEITATVKKTAISSMEANAAVQAAQKDAVASGSIVTRAVQAMSQIEQSSGQIGQIIGVIDEIAFQTNLLALNAGVEAARAGDAGRGFAVVASEVRALAQRSAAAAKEIKMLILTSENQVKDGVKLVGEVGRALARIVEHVVTVNDIMAGISASAQEQASGLSQVNTAVNQMDQVTQQNAAMVEEATAAARSLDQETNELSRLVERFNLGAANDLPRMASTVGPFSVPSHSIPVIRRRA